MAKKPIKMDELRFEFDCQASLEPGCGSARYCSSCEETVWDVSKLTRAQYESLPATACIMATFQDETLQFAPEPKPLRTRFAAIAAAGVFSLPFLGCGSEATQTIATVQSVEPAQSPEEQTNSGPGAASLTDVSPSEVPAPLAGEHVNVEPPAELTAAERRFVHRLRTEFGIVVEGVDYPAYEPSRARRTTLRSALEKIEVIQKRRDLRTGAKSERPSKMTLREALEDLEVRQGKRKRRVFKGKPRRANRTDIRIGLIIENR